MTDDEVEIRALIQHQFDSIKWDAGQQPDWRAVHEGYVPGAPVWPAFRPARAQSAADLTARLRKLRDERMLDAFFEKGVGCHVWIVGNIAVALAGCEMTENDSTITRDISGYLLVKHYDGWHMAAQTWDVVDDIEVAFAEAGLGDA